MAVTPSNMIQLGSIAPDFELLDVISGKELTLKNLKGKLGTVIMFICVHCPFVKHLEEKIAMVSSKYMKKGISFVAINSNDIIAYPDDAPDQMKKQAEFNHFKFPYLYDESQKVAHAYDAACTPDFYFFNKELQCVYRGRFDESAPSNDELVTGKDLSDAMDQLITGKPINPKQNPSIGCGIKWKS